MASPEQNKPWSPPDESNNGSNKCWVNAPLYAILSNNEIRRRVNNIEVPTEDELKGLSDALNLPTMENLKTALNDIDVNTITGIEGLNTNRQICIDLANAENNTLLNRLHITIFLLVLQNVNPALIPTTNKYLSNVTLKSIASVDTQQNPLLRPLYGPAIKQFIDPDIPWTDVLYRTFAFLILRRQVTHEGNVAPRIQNVILGSGSEDASSTIGFIEDVFNRDLNIKKVDWAQYPPVPGSITSTLNINFDQTNLISIVSATKCTTPVQQDSDHFKSYVKIGDIWFEVDALHGSIGNFNSNQIQWSEIVNQYNCEDTVNENRVMYTILYEPVPVLPEQEQEPVPVPVPVPVSTTTETEKKPSPFFQTIIEQLPANSTSQPNKGYIKLLNIAFTRYNKNEPLLADGKLMLKKFKPSNINGKQVNYSPITDDNNFKQFDTDINALYRAATAGNSEIRKRSEGGKKTRKARLPLQKKPVTSNRTRSRNRNSKKRIR